MKKINNIWKIIWLVGVYVILLLILYLVVTYKVKWEDRDLNKYLYFYDCSGELCTTDYNIKQYYASIMCPNKECPFIKETRGDFVILSNNEKEYLYNYRDKKVVSDKYLTYSFASSDNYYIVSDESKMYGIIDGEGNVVVDVSYEYISDYYDGYIAFTANEKYGIFNKEKKIDIDPVYENVLLIDDKNFVYTKDGEYFIASYETKESDNPYNYIYVYNGAILTVKEGQINILDYDLNSQLASPLLCYFPYTREQERATLRIKAHNNLLEFSIKDENQKYNNYMYHTKGHILFGE